jgi:RNA polymerase sigma-70 factor (ECF subfamily)
MLLCAHPAIDPGVRTPLMLQTVLGLDAGRIAAAFLTSPDAMGRRLSRAKAKIRDAGVPFEPPEAGELPARAGAVLEAVYAAYGSGWDDVSGADPRRRGLAEEAVWLGRAVRNLMPDDPEAAGLLALMLHCEARRGARRGPSGEYVPLDRQDPARRSAELIAEAEAVLASAARMGRPGRFQLKAAIQSVHAARAVTGTTDWPVLALLYEALMRAAPTVGAALGRAAAVGEASGPHAGLAALEAIPASVTADHQPYWALRGHLLARLDRRGEAAEAYRRACGLSEDPAVRAFLAERADGVMKADG